MAVNTIVRSTLSPWEDEGSETLKALLGDISRDDFSRSSVADLLEQIHRMDGFPPHVEDSVLAAIYRLRMQRKR